MGTQSIGLSRRISSNDCGIYFDYEWAFILLFCYLVVMLK